MNRWHRRFLGSKSLPAELTDFEVEHYFTLSPALVTAIRSRYTDNHRIAIALQLGFLKLAGRPLAALRVVPATLLRHVARQLDIEQPPSIASLRTLYRRRATLYTHQAWVIEHSGLINCGRRQRAALAEFFGVEAATAPSIDALVQSGREWLYENRILVPATSTLRDLALVAYTATDRGNHDLICAEIPTATRERWLEAVLRRCDEDERSVLQWLQQPPQRPSPSTVRREFRKLDVLRTLGVADYPLRGIPLEKLRGYAQRLRSQRPSRFTAVTDPRRTLELVGFLHVALLDTTDGIVQLTGRRTLSFVRKARTRAEAVEIERLHAYKALVRDIEDILVDASLPAPMARERALERIRHAPAVPFPTKAAATRHVLSERNGRLRATLTQLASLDIRGSDENALEAVRRLRELYARNAQSLPEGDLPPCGSVWQELVGGEDRQRALQAFEAATLLELRRALKRGSLWIAHSAAYRDSALHLIDEKRWQRERRHHLAKLALPADARTYLDSIRDLLHGGMAALSAAVADGHVRTDDGVVRIGALKAKPLPAGVQRQKSDLLRELGTAQLPDVILEVDGQTRFSWELLGRAPRSGKELVTLYAALIAHGTATEAAGVARMIPGLGARRVLGMMATLESSGALERANKAVVGLLRAQPVASVWGDGRVAASDMMSIEASKHLWRARVDPRRRTFALGVYHHVIDQWGLVYDQPILLGERQAGAAIEGAIRQTAPRIERVAVDTHGYTNSALAVGKLLSLDILPRLRNLSERKLFVPRGMDVPENLAAVTDACVSERAIAAQWDELTRLAASIEAGIVTADVALARFASAANAGTPLHRAADQIGRLLRTVFLCDYLSNEAFRREMHRLLGHGESVHTLQRAIFFGQLPTHRGRRQEEAIAVSGSLTLLTNIVIAWTACRIQRILAGREVTDVMAPEQDWLRHVSPARNEEVNFRGTYHFPVSLYAERVLEHRDGVSAHAS